MKVLSIIFALFFSFLLIQCSDPPVVGPADNEVACFKGPGNGGHGGETETVPNNLSFPVLLADGATVPVFTDTAFTVPYDGYFPGLTDLEIAWLNDNGPWYAQQTDGNVWQADYADYVAGVDEVYYIDWGDMIEAVAPKIRRPYRLELSLFAQRTVAMSAYTMVLLENPSSPDELQGTDKSRYDCYWATVATPNGHLIVQRTEGVDMTTIAWDPINYKWTGTGVGDPLDISFAQELNVGGKYIFGASTGGWKPNDIGDYRITFYFEGGVVSMANAYVANYLNQQEPPAELTQGETNTPYVDGANNLTFVDVTVVGGGGGGGGGNH
jgi:hypothetical protein